MLRALLALVLLVGSGCTLDFDAAGPQGASTAGGGGQGEGAGASEPSAGAAAGGAAGCSGKNGSCVAVPVGFSGPFELRAGESCAGNAVLLGTLDGLPVTAEPATCGCQCVFGAETCGHLQLFSNGGCNMAPGGDDFVAGVCTNVPDIMSFKPQQGPAGSVACESDKVDPLPLVPFAFQEPFAVCEIESDIDCPDGGCLPEEEGRYCLRSDEGQPCPAEVFTVPTVFRTVDDYTDTRTCSCECSLAASSPTCGAGTVAAFSQANCQAPINTFTMGSACQPLSMKAKTLIVQPLVTGGACGAPETDEAGDVQETQDAGTQLCCTP